MFVIGVVRVEIHSLYVRAWSPVCITVCIYSVYIFVVKTSLYDNVLQEVLKLYSFMFHL